MPRQPRLVGVQLHSRASEILKERGKADNYSSEDYLRALAQAESELDSDIPRGPQLAPDEHGLEGAALTTVTNHILAKENRLDDADRFLEVFTALARRHALRGYLNPNEQEQDDGA